MRRTYAGRSGAQVKSSEGEQGFWPSYADMMSAVALILFFLMLLSYIQNLITGNDLQNTQEVLEDTRTQLSVTLGEVDKAADELGKITLDLNDARLALAEQQEELAGLDKLLGERNALITQQNEEIDAKNAQIAKSSALIDEQQAKLDSQSALIGEQAAYLKSANEELVEMRNQMQTIAVLRLSILEQMRDSIVKVMGDASKVSIGDNGNIVLSEGIFFDVGSSQIKSEASPALNQLITVFDKFLSDPENAKYVDSIVISGHTDSTGTPEKNRSLSTDRANAVLSYLLSGKSGVLDKYSEYFCAAGYGETRPVADNNTVDGRAANRRIEISIILRDDTIMDIVDEYLELEVPETDGVTVHTGSTGGNASGTGRH